MDRGKSVYLATVVDLASRRLAGWVLADHMRTGVVTDALAAAERCRGSLAGAILRIDHGAQYQPCVHRRLPQNRCPSVHERDRLQCEQRARRVFDATFERETLRGETNWPSEREARLDAAG